MRKRLGWLIAVASLCAPSVAFAQMSYEVPPTIFTGPLSHPRYEEGGIFFGFDLLYWKTNRPIASQTIAKRGFLDNDGSIVGQGPNFFVGSGEEALNTRQLAGPGVFQPGFDMHLGWRFASGVVVELNWKHLTQAKYHAAASVLPPSFNVGGELQNTFLFSPVSNFPPEFAGSDQNVAAGNPGATYGIWNAATVMQIELIQRFDLYGINARVPIIENYSYRSYGLFGPRIAWLYDRFRWRTVDMDLTGNAGPDTTGIYSNYVSNRMYGVHAGFGSDWFLGANRLGGWSLTCDVEGGLHANLVKARGAYELADRSIVYSRGRRFATIVPSAEAKLGMTWYPWEAISIYANYNFMAFFNTMASPKPIDFNVGIVDPQYEHYFMRYFYGFQVGISFVF